MFLLKNFMVLAILGGLGSLANAQTTTPLLWKVQADDLNSSYILSASDGARGMFIDPNPGTGGSLLVASRAGGNLVRRVDPATGLLRDTAVIPTHGYRTTSLFPLNKVVVSDDGVIYVTSLATTTAGQRFHIYRHANESTAETVAFEVATDNTDANARMGDDADIIGTGNNTKILVAGSGGSMQLFTTTDNGMTFTRTAITGGPFTGSPHIAWDPVTPNRFWYRGTGGELAQAFDISGSVATASTGAGNVLPSQAVAPAYGPFDIGLVNAEKSVVLAIGNSLATTTGKPVVTYRLSDLVNTFAGYGSEFSGGAKTNGNGAGEVYLDSGNGVYYVLYTNNSVTKYRIPGSSVDEWDLF